MSQPQVLIDTTNFSDINIDKIKQKLGEGLNHVVYEYDEAKVIKIPKKKVGLRYSNTAQLHSDLQLIHTYFPHLAAETHILHSEDGTEYCVIQELLINGEEVSMDKMAAVRKDVQHIVTQNKKLYQETGHSLDLFGSMGFMSGLLGLVLPGVKPRLSNILMTKSGNFYKLSLVDTELLRLRVGSQDWSSVQQWLRAWVSFYLTTFLLKVVFKVS